MSSVLAYMSEQPEALERASAPWSEDLLHALHETGARVARVVYVGSGTSSFAAHAVEAYATRVLPHAEVHVLTPSAATTALPLERLDERTLVIAISQTARSVLVRDAVDRARAGGARTMFVTGSPDRAPQVDIVLDIGAGREDVGAKTKGYTSTVVTLLRVTSALAGAPVVDGLALAQDAARAALTEADGAIAAFGARIDLAEGVHRVGTQAHLATAQEAAHKIVEIARIGATAHEVEEFTHGHHRRLTSASAVVIVATAHPALERAVALERWLRSVGVATLVVTDRVARFPDAPEVVSLPTVPPELAPIPAVIPLQRLALVLAARREVSPEEPLYPEIDSLLARKDLS